MKIEKMEDLQKVGTELDCLAYLVSSHIYKVVHYGAGAEDEMIGFYLQEKIREISTAIFNFMENQE